MINSINVIRNVGQFSSVAISNGIPLDRLTLIYAENGRGKTTLAAIFRSLAQNNANIIGERHRLGAQDPPHVVMKYDGNMVAFQRNGWNRNLPSIVVFDEEFINQNVYSGLLVDSEHRQNLHELILGAQGVTIAKRLQELVGRVEEHNSALRKKREAIPENIRYGLSIDEFTQLPARDDIDQSIQETERKLTAVKEQAKIRNAKLFDSITLPTINIEEIKQILSQDIPSLDMVAISRVQQHLVHIGVGSEAWVSEGMGRLNQNEDDVCPFCGQDLAQSQIIKHYRTYFSNAYAELKNAVTDTLNTVNITHGGDRIAAVERLIRVSVETQAFWSEFIDLDVIDIDTEIVARDWAAMRELLIEKLKEKQAAPLEPMELDEETSSAMLVYEKHCRCFARLNDSLQQANIEINRFKEQTKIEDVNQLTTTLNRLNAIKQRHVPNIAALCDDYLNELSAKRVTEQQRDEVRQELNQYRESIFVNYQQKVNLYLQQFSVGFRLERLTPAQVRNGATCTYNVLVNNTPIAVTDNTLGRPSFRTVLSAGDRNTLALAFFLATIDLDPNPNTKVVVIDDPISSLDDNRSVTTVQAIRHLSTKVEQVIVLSHNKRFLAGMWNPHASGTTVTLMVMRDGGGSTLTTWMVEQDLYTEHDRIHEQLRDYMKGQTNDSRAVAMGIRPLLEGFFRVAYPDHCKPGSLLGQFVNKCRGKVGTPDQILSSQDIQELEDIKEYANRFHHDTNPAWQNAEVNDSELLGFIQRALEFTRRPISVVYRVGSP